MGCAIELKSITYAIKARDLLKKNKIRATIEKLNGKHKKGCGYFIVLNEKCSVATELLERNGIEILSIS